MIKVAQLLKLAALRCSTQINGYTHPEDHGYDFTNLVSPYTRTAGSVDAEIMIVLQDWTSADGLRKLGYREEIQQLGHYPKLRTNVRLKRLLLKHFGLALEHTYGTNVFPFVKPLGMSAQIPQAMLRDGAKQFTLHEFDIVGPLIVLAFGAATADALRYAGVGAIELPHPAARISNVAMDEAWHGAVKQAADAHVRVWESESRTVAPKPSWRRPTSPVK